MAEEGPDIALDYEAPDLLCLRFEVVLVVIEMIVEQFAACDRPLATSLGTRMNLADHERRLRLFIFAIVAKQRRLEARTVSGFQIAVKILPPRIELPHPPLRYPLSSGP
jgi:hypothetical protein